jgi:hypothetical protein
VKLIIFDKKRNKCEALMFKGIRLRCIDYSPRDFEFKEKVGLIVPSDKIRTTTVSLTFDVKHTDINSISCNKLKYVPDIIKKVKEFLDL